MRKRRGKKKGKETSLTAPFLWSVLSQSCSTSECTVTQFTCFGRVEGALWVMQQCTPLLWAGSSTVSPSSFVRLSSLAGRAGPGPPAPRAGLETPLLLLVRRVCGHTLKEEEIRSFLPAELPPLAAAVPQSIPERIIKRQNWWVWYQALNSGLFPQQLAPVQQHGAEAAPLEAPARLRLAALAFPQPAPGRKRIAVLLHQVPLHQFYFTSGIIHR